MKMIVISEEVFNKLFQEALSELELENLREKYFANPVDKDSLHRKFHYTVSVLKDKLTKA